MRAYERVVGARVARADGDDPERLAHFAVGRFLQLTAEGLTEDVARELAVADTVQVAALARWMTSGRG